GREQILVDRVLSLDREDRDAAEAELFVKRDRLVVVVHYGEVEKGRAAGLEMLGDAPDQHLADAGMAHLRIDRQAPERRAVLGIVEDPVMVDAAYRPDYVAARLVLGDEAGDGARIAVRPVYIRPLRDHAASRIDRVDAFCIAFRGQPAD